jgi:sterol desaturase/sphingolipid hydroxylase (fatty acid hydroxylase superfamily)
VPPDPNRRASDRHDRRWTLVTLALTTVVGAATTAAVVSGAMPLELAWPTPRRFAGECALYVLLFDAYFYGLHRALHGRILFRRVHAVHHRSGTPTVATALAMHPVESLAIVGFMPVAMALVPIHLASLLAVVVFLTGSLLVAHCGYAVFPRWWERVPLLNWYVTPRVHDVHHVHRVGNYSATLSLFDRAFGTYAAPVIDR